MLRRADMLVPTGDAQLRWRKYSFPLSLVPLYKHKAAWYKRRLLTRPNPPQPRAQTTTSLEVYNPQVAMSLRSILLYSLAGSAYAASVCPFGQLAERGELSEDDAAKYYAARSEGSHAVRELMHVESQKRDSHAAQEKFYKRQVKARQLGLGGGLLGGVLQPLTGVLENLGLPT